MAVTRHISRRAYSKAKQSLEKLINGVPIIDEESGDLIGWIEKPDINAIKYAIDKYDEQLREKKYGS